MEYHTILITKDPENEDLKHEKRIFESKIEALKAMKIWKTCHPRLKTFSNLEEAEENVAKILEIENSNKTESSSEGCPYKGLTPQQLKQIKEAILKDNAQIIKDLVAQNPRYLMTPCDQPAIIHSGTRANALHIAANAGKVKMIELILDLITDPSLVERMYPNESAESIAKRQEYLLDLYLNMPKKGDFDTPLHQASKWGHWQVIQILVEYSSCDTKRTNRDGLTPAQVVCSRATGDADVKCKILDLLADRLYIPVCRALDNASPGFIGEPVSPAELSSTTEFKTSSPKLLRSPMSKAVMNSPIVIRDDAQASSPILSPITDRAYLGPLSPKDAELVKHEWKKNSLKKKVNLTDPDKGMEQQGRILAKKYQTTLEEYWFFLRAYVDLTSDKGLIMLENHLQDQQRKMENVQDTLDDLEAEMAKLNIKSDTIGSGDKTQDLNANSNQLGVLNLLTNDNNVKDFQFKTSAVQELDNSYIWNQPRQAPVGDLSSSLIRSNSESSIDSFLSAVSDLSEQSVWSAQEGQWVYLEGTQPSKTDHQVYQIIQDCHIDPTKYPSVHTWKCLVESYLPSERKAWTRATSVPKKSFVIPTLSYD